MAAHPGGGAADQRTIDKYWCCRTQLSTIFASTVSWLAAGPAHLSAVRPTSIHRGQHGRPAVCMQWRRGGVPPSPGTGRSRYPPCVRAAGVPLRRSTDSRSGAFRPLVDAALSATFARSPDTSARLAARGSEDRVRWWSWRIVGRRDPVSQGYGCFDLPAISTEHLRCDVP